MYSPPQHSSRVLFQPKSQTRVSIANIRKFCMECCHLPSPACALLNLHLNLICPHGFKHHFTLTTLPFRPLAQNTPEFQIHLKKTQLPI